jgi:hypothetical protein
VTRQHRPDHLGLRELDRGRGVEHGVLRRDPQQHGDVTELEVPVDEDHALVGSWVRRAIATETLTATVLFPTPPFVEKTAMSLPGAPRRSAIAGTRELVPTIRSPTRPTDCESAVPSFTDTVSRAPARSAAWRTVVDTSSTANSAPSSG